MKKTYIIKRFLVLLLAMYTLSGLAPIKTLAEGPTSVTTAAELISVFSDGGAAVLASNIILTEPLVAASGKTVTLDLNGKTIDRGLTEGSAALNGNVITVSGSLTLNDSAGSGRITGGRKSGFTGGGGIYVAGAGTLTMNGGSISGNTAEGGSVNGSIAGGYGGGVYVAAGGAFAMSTGAVSNNRSAGNGGGIYVETNGSLSMSNGSISSNTAAKSGGGVYVEGSPFTMGNGTISGNTASGSESGAGDGGGVAVVMGGVFTMNSGNISGNTAAGNGGGVYVFLGGVLAMNAGTVSSNAAVYGGGIYFDKTQNPAYGEGTLSINGGEVSGNTATSNGGGVYVASGAFSANSCVISGNRAMQGGGVYMLGGSGTMENSEISENTTYVDLSSQGGGVYIASGALTMKSGEIDRNKAASGGGVYAFSGTFTMESGRINENSTYALEGLLCDGGGVYVNTGSTFCMKGGEICNNTTSPWNMYHYGGGVYIYGGIFKVSGGAKISNNSRGGVPNNVYLKTNGEIIQIEGQLTGADGSIGISTGVTEAAPLTVAQGSGYTISEGDKMKFTRDTGGILNLADNKITLPDPDTSYLIYLSYNANGGSGSQLSSAILKGTPNSMTVASGDGFSRTYCSFARWNTAADGSGASYQPGDTLTLTENTVLNAQWTIDRAELTVTAPQGGAVPSSSAACVPAGCTASLTWKQDANPFAGNFDYNTVYSVEVTLTAASGCKFAGGPEATVNDQSVDSVQRTSDTTLVVSYTFTKTGPRSTPTATLGQTTINIANTGGTTPLSLNVAGITENYNSVTWTMNETEDNGNILTLPLTTAGTLVNGALSLGSVTVAPNAAGQPAKSASVTISFSGNESGEYTGLPASITVNFQLTAGGAPTAVMDFINERITGVSSEMEYTMNESSGAPADWTGAVTVTGTEISISDSIPGAGSVSKYIHIRYKGMSGSEPKNIEIPDRPDLTEELDWDSWVVHNIENDIESGYVPADFGYRINNGADDINSSGWDLDIPLNPGDTLTFWMPASSSNFKSGEITVTAPARLPNTDVVIDFTTEKLTATAAMEYRMSPEDVWKSCTANMTATAFGWNGAAAVSVQLHYPCTADNYASQTQNLTIPARPAAPSVSYTATATTITIAAEPGVRYRLDGGQWKTADENGKVIFIGLTVNQSYTVDAQKSATDSAFQSAVTSLPVSTSSLADGTGSVSMASWTYGGTAAEPLPVSVTNGTDDITYTYAGTKADGTAYSSSAKPTDAGSYTVTATFAATSDYKQVISLEASFTIVKKEIDVQWKNLTDVYDGAPKSPAFALIGVESGDTADVSAQLSESKTGAGSYSVTAALSGSRAYNYSLTNPSGTLVIQKAPVIFSITADSAQHDGSGHTAAVTATASGSDFSAFSVFYRNSDSNTVASPSDEGSYGIYVQITDANYRHADATDGTAKKIGVLTIYAASAPDTYTVSFSSGEGAVGSVTALTAVQAGTIRILPDSTGMTNGTKLFAGWKYGGKVYQPGESLPQPDSDITLIAIWIKNNYTISGVVYQGGNSLPDTVVTLMRGCVQVGQTVTGAGGEYSFANAVPGPYNLVACKNGVTQTVLVEIIQDGVTIQNITLPSGRTNSVVEVAAGSPAIVVGHLEQTFSNADQQAAGNGSTVEMKLNAKALEGSGVEQAAIDAAAGCTVGLYLELNLTRTVTPSVGVPGTPAFTESSVLLDVVVQIPGELQGKDNYVVYRRHNGEMQTLTTAPNNIGECITVNTDKTAITIHAKLFSTYAIGYAAQATPVSGGNDLSSADYTITTTAGDGGSISPVGSISVTKGSTKTFSITPDKGYVISDVLVDNVSVGAVSSYNFSNITASHTIKAVFDEATGLPYYLDDGGGKMFIGFSSDASGSMKYIAPEGKAVLFTPNPKSFTDISGHWGKSYIDFVTEREIFVGTGSTVFLPDAGMSRAMFATIIGRLYEHSYGKIEAAGSNTFDDCDYGTYYGKYVDWTAKEGIIEGYGNGRFGPDDQITREQMAVILYRFADFLGVLPGDMDTALNYLDAATISSWAERAALYCQSTGIISGHGSGIFAPWETATRAETATMIERFIESVMA